MVGYAKKSTENKRLYTVRNFSVLDSVGETLHTFSAQGISFFCRPFLVGHGYAWKDSKRLHLRAAVIIFRVFPCNYYKKTSKNEFYRRGVPASENKRYKDAYVDYGATDDIPEDACSLKAVWRFDSIELK